MSPPDERVGKERPENIPNEDSRGFETLRNVDELSSEAIKALDNLGYTVPIHLRYASQESLTQLQGVSRAEARRIKEVFTRA